MTTGQLGLFILIVVLGFAALFVAFREPVCRVDSVSGPSGCGGGSVRCTPIGGY